MGSMSALPLVRGLCCDRDDPLGGRSPPTLSACLLARLRSCRSLCWHWPPLKGRAFGNVAVTAVFEEQVRLCVWGGVS